jgi:hypothetical protein
MYMYLPMKWLVVLLATSLLAVAALLLRVASLHREIASLLDARARSDCAAVSSMPTTGPTSLVLAHKEPNAVAQRRLAQRHGKAATARPTAARRDAECVQIPSKPNLPPTRTFAVASINESSAAPFDLSEHRAPFCKWYRGITGYTECKAFPTTAGQAERCKVELRAAHLRPSHSEVHAAVRLLATKKILIIGDSTMLNKFVFLRFLGLPSSCTSGNGVCTPAAPHAAHTRARIPQHPCTHACTRRFRGVCPSILFVLHAHARGHAIC